MTGIVASHKYKITTGQWWHRGVYLGTGYSGYEDGDGVLEPGEGKNDPTKTDQKGVGPLPVGFYRISKPYLDPHRGPNTMRLTPLPGTEMFHRDGFLIHGDFKDPALQGTCSHGCVVLLPFVRSIVAKFVTLGDDILEVVA